jgi:calcium-translocating P-type ATPase
MLGLQEERKDTPLQAKLDRLASLIGYGGGAVAILLFAILTINWAVVGAERPEHFILEFLIIAITIVVVAVPEGLPLAVTISLAYSMKKMLLDNNFVRHLKACETMGNATTICSDKTGTLTTNRMSVQQVFMYGRRFMRADLVSTPEQPGEVLNPIVHQLLMNCICANTKSFQGEAKTQAERDAIAEGKQKKRLTGGNQTDCAMLQFAIDLGATNYKDRRKNCPISKMFPFDSKVKRSSVLITCNADNANGAQYLMYAKGAAELMLDVCTFYMDQNGETQPMSEAEKQEVTRAMGVMASRGLRCLGICYKSFARQDIPFTSNGQINDEDCAPLFENMIWICVSGIQDPVRDEVPAAVETCHRAGIVVRMVTGDHLETAKHIAKECHILTCADHVCMTGEEFRNLSEDEKKRLLPRLRVLARSKPKDKEQLVRWYREHNNDIVATTGDGANDALALKEADIGLSMGIQGTDVAKEASDIIIMDDNFASIEKTVMWGRSVYDNIRKFVQFQLTVNVVALTISLIAAFWTEFANPLTAVQLLWVNLIMDTMAALALATEDPTRKLLDRHPFKPDSPLITYVLWRFVFGHSIYQLTALLLTMFKADEWLDLGGIPEGELQNKVHLTVIFNVFVWMQIFNEFNARRVANEWNVFENLFQNLYFWFIMCITVVLQILMVEFFGAFTSTVPLNGKQWAYCLGIGAGTLLWHQVVRLFPVNLNHGVKEVDASVLFKREKEFAPDYYQEVGSETDDGGRNGYGKSNSNSNSNNEATQGDVEIVTAK